jgi:hypothetical protein
LPPLRIGDLVTDGDLMTLARRAATETFERDPRLERTESRPYADLLASHRKLTDVAN